MKSKQTSSILPSLWLWVFGVLMLCNVQVQAQCIEQVDLGDPTNTVDNFLTGINNQGFITGYRLAGPAPVHYVGFVIDPHGQIRYITPAMVDSLSTDIEIEGINDSNVIVIQALKGNSSAIYKGYYQGYNVSRADSFAVKAVAGNQQPGLAIPFGINNRNDITGWYKGGITKWAFILRDSIPVNGSSWDAHRYVQNSVFYNSLGTGTNDNGITCGFYEDGSTYGPFVYNNATKTYTFLNTAFKMKLWGINNDEVLVGEYARTNGFHAGFWGKVLPSGVIQVHSLRSIFLNDTVQSVARGINQKGEVVGSFRHPRDGHWVGFVYRPNQTEYRLPGFDYGRDAWTMLNSDVQNSNSIWTSKYFKNFDYYHTDPYAQSSIPVMDTFMRQMHHLRGLKNSYSPSYRGVAEESDAQGIGTNPNPLVQQIYQHILKPALVTKWLKHGNTAFYGYCYGFSYTSLQHHLNPAEFQAWSGLSPSISLPQVPNTDTASIRAIERYELKWFDRGVRASSNSAFFPVFGGLMQMKNDFNTSFETCRPHDIVFSYPTSGSHSVLPYKIHTPQILPFDYPFEVWDSVFIYDSNFPKDSTQAILIRSWNANFNAEQFSDRSYPALKTIFLNEASVRDLTPDIKEHTVYKIVGKHSGIAELPPTSQSDDSLISLSLGKEGVYYKIIGNSGGTASLDEHGFSNTVGKLEPVFSPEFGDTIPNYFTTDSSSGFNFSSFHYTDSVMNWSSATTVTRTMSLSRDALPGETDNGFMSAHKIAYGSHDASAKSLSGSLIENDASLSQGVTVMVHDLAVGSGDSILTENPAPYTYKVTRIGGTNGTYNLWLYAILNDSVKEFKADQITLPANSSHIITPYFKGPHGSQVAILVDQGNTGHYNDTLFVQNTASAPTAAPVGAIQMSPNPVADVLTITFGGQEEEAYQLIISDVTGKSVETRASVPGEKELEISTASYRSGVYFVRLTNKNGAAIFNGKFLKE